ncbi:DUF2334 domain-containing protein, partial [Pseudomonas aeruginosa]|uniref:DUF2334 domain-containing protein n=1 Tax=Pseudomonas aeruginosa TaxID=287 RepID=UPI003D1622AA
MPGTRWSPVCSCTTTRYSATARRGSRAMAERSLLLVLHDVAPETWPDYRPFVEAVDALGEVPMTWLVVPDFHHRNPLEADEKFCKLLSRR